MDKKGGGREYHDFPSKFVCLTVPKDFVRESLCNSEKIRYEEKSMVKRGVARQYHDFPSNFFVSQNPNVS